MTDLNLLNQGGQNGGALPDDLGTEPPGDAEADALRARFIGLALAQPLVRP